MRTPLSGLSLPYFSRMDIRPGISCSATGDFLAAPIGEREVLDVVILFGLAVSVDTAAVLSLRVVEFSLTVAINV